FNAARAACTARSTSSTVPSATSAIGASVAGSRSVEYLPPLGGTASPPISSSWRISSRGLFIAASLWVTRVVHGRREYTVADIHYFLSLLLAIVYAFNSCENLSIYSWIYVECAAKRVDPVTHTMWDRSRRTNCTDGQPR